MDVILSTTFTPYRPGSSVKIQADILKILINDKRVLFGVIYPGGVPVQLFNTTRYGIEINGNRINGGSNLIGAGRWISNDYDVDLTILKAQVIQNALEKKEPITITNITQMTLGAFDVATKIPEYDMPITVIQTTVTIEKQKHDGVHIKPGRK